LQRRKQDQGRDVGDRNARAAEDVTLQAQMQAEAEEAKFYGERQQADAVSL
jgi:hypothetical protein